ncbi:MAG: SpoIIE family protein phosphatase [Bacteroidales bacterium]|nr:SpoIIE family protein phosphatase [Bacteroidales bacterium]MBN2764444.1 SpoIIE family protein phosphatase [Bacteroidales bacterium]
MKDNKTSKTSISRLQLTTFKLQSLLNITQAINENLTQEELLKIYEKLLTRDLSIGKVLVFIYEDKWKCMLNTGEVGKAYENIDVERDLLPIQDISFITSSPNKALDSFDIVIPVINKNVAIAYVIIGDIEEGEGVSPIIKHLNFIQTLTNIIVVAIENIRLFKESLRQEAIKKELELASKVQNMLIPNPSVLPKNDKISMSSFYHPHFEVGGDYYDYIPLSKNEFGFCISDVSGKGMSAALLMSNFQANLRALYTHDVTLDALIEKLNERVMASTNGEKFITLFIAKFNYKTRELEYINAGHNQPILYLKRKKELLFLHKGCVGIGMLDEIPLIRKGSITIEEPAKILCYTDGLTELIDGKKISFGTKEIEECIINNYSIEENIQTIIKKQGILDGNAAIFDDISILGIELF